MANADVHVCANRTTCMDRETNTGSVKSKHVSSNKHIRMDDDSSLQGLGSFLNHDVIYDDGSGLIHMIFIIVYLLCLLYNTITHRQAVLMLCFYFIYV